MKIVMVVNKYLPTGLVANTTAVLGITLYTKKLLKTRNRDLEFSGLCLSGSKKEVNRITATL